MVTLFIFQLVKKFSQKKFWFYINTIYFQIKNLTTFDQNSIKKAT